MNPDDARGRTIHLVEPELVVDPSRRLAPIHVRMVGRLLGVTEFLRMSVGLSEHRASGESPATASAASMNRA